MSKQAKFLWLLGSGLVLGGCASTFPETFSRIDPENIDAVKGVLRFERDYDRCRDQPVAETVLQFREAAAAKCNGDQACEEQTWQKLVNGEYSLGKAVKGAADGSAIGLVPLAVGSSTASWGRVSLAGALLGLLSTTRGPSLKECTIKAMPRLFDQDGKRISFACMSWGYKSKNLPVDGEYSEQERAELLLSSGFNKRYILDNEGMTVVNTYKRGMMIEARCSIMSEEDFRLVQKFYPVQLKEARVVEEN